MPARNPIIERLAKPSQLGLDSATAVGAASLAALGAACCVGPALVAVLGIGGAMAATALEPFRPYLLTVAAAAVGLAFWRAYRPERCETDACRTRTPGRVLAWIAAVVTASAFLAPRLLEVGISS